MTLDEIRELIKVVTESGVAELELQRGENRVRIRRGGSVQRHDIVLPGDLTANPRTAPAPVEATSPAAAAAEALADPSLTIVKSPIVGTFYEAPSPGAPPFVKVGDSVQVGQVLCIIESMKLMNEIEAEFSGTVVAQYAANAQPVEYGESLFAIRPL